MVMMLSHTFCSELYFFQQVLCVLLNLWWELVYSLSELFNCFAFWFILSEVFSTFWCHKCIFFHVWSFIFFHVTNIQISKDYNLSNHIISLLNLTAIAECLHFSRDLSDETKSLCQKLVCQMNYSEIHFACKCVLFPEVHTWFGAKLRNCSYSLNHFIASTLFFNALYSLHILQIWICKYVLLCDV